MRLLFSRRFCASFLVVFALPFFAGFPVAHGANGADEEEGVGKWRESAVEFPAPPLNENLLQFYVSAATDNRFFIDGSTLAVGSDGVVRYVVVIETSGGARNVTFEGLRCATRERRLYASGRADGSWSRSRNDQWSKIQTSAANRYHAALYLDYFCPDDIIVRSAEVARDALRRGEKSGQIDILRR